MTLIQQLFDEYTALAKACAELKLERDAIRCAFAEASHLAGPAFVAHEELAALRATNVQLIAERAALESAIWPDAPAGTPIEAIIQRATTQRLVWETAHLQDNPDIDAIT